MNLNLFEQYTHANAFVNTIIHHSCTHVGWSVCVCVCVCAMHATDRMRNEKLKNWSTHDSVSYLTMPTSYERKLISSRKNIKKFEHMWLMIQCGTDTHTHHSHIFHTMGMLNRIHLTAICCEQNHHLDKVGAVFAWTAGQPLNVFVQIGYDIAVQRQRIANLQRVVLEISDNWLMIHSVCSNQREFKWKKN